MNHADRVTEASLTAHIGRSGALIGVELSLTELDVHRRQAGLVPLPLALPKRGHGVVDTGAEASVVSDSAAEALRLEPIRMVPVRTVHDERLEAVCAVRVRLAVDQLPGPRAMEVYAVRRPLRSVVMLVGRDMLRHGRLIWDGPASTATLRLPAATS